jgi:hypothetical protein
MRSKVRKLPVDGGDDRLAPTCPLGLVGRGVELAQLLVRSGPTTDTA